MTRRPLAGAALAAALVSTGAGGFVSPAVADACLSWTDAKGDSAVAAVTQASAATNESPLDVLGASIDTSDGVLTMAVKVADLTTAPGGRVPGDRFVFRFTVNGKIAQLSASRDVNAGTSTVAWTVDAVAKTPKPVVSYDAAADTVTARLPLSDFAEVTGAGPGAALRSFYAESRGVLGAPTAGTLVSPQWDAAPAPLWYVHSLGSGCTAAAAAPPLGVPNAECQIFTDGKGDGKTTPPSVHSAVPTGSVETDNDPDLDIVGVVGQTTADEVRLYTRVDKLATLPARGNGHNYKVSFTAPGNKLVAADVSELHSALLTGGILLTTPRVLVAGTDRSANVPSYAVFDRTKSMVTMVLDRGSLAAFTGEPLPAGAELTGVYAESRAVIGASFFPADEAPNALNPAVVYKLGDNKCFAPPPAKLAGLAAVTVPFGDVASVAAKLTDSGGAALPGKRLTFSVGGDSVAATTGADGVARAALTSSKTAGTYPMTVAFAGDDTADKVSASTPFTVVTEATRLTLAVAKSGSSRTVTATLKEDDGKVLGGQKVDWYVNGKKVATGATDAGGRTVLKTAKPTQVVLAKFAGVAGKWGASSVSAKL